VKEPLFKAVSSPYLAPYDGSFRIAHARTRPPKGTSGKAALRARLGSTVDRISSLQETLFAENHWAALFVFQAMDAAGKDSTIRSVLSGVNPAGCEVSTFKTPSAKELDHDFLWRTTIALPERGRIGVFNRSHYEEVLVVRVHADFLEAQRIPGARDSKRLWKSRYESIVAHELHLARNGYMIVKFWLNVSKEEQRRRFLSRLEEAKKYWKFSEADVGEREHWNAYMEAYEDAIRATSRPWAPWYAIPADNKDFMRLTVADLIERSLKRLDIAYPEPVIPRHKLTQVRAVLRGGKTAKK
jgi:PPK2 family polyphosphate:nucleotide phosphotransferase